MSPKSTAILTMPSPFSLPGRTRASHAAKSGSCSHGTRRSNVARDCDVCQKRNGATSQHDAKHSTNASRCRWRTSRVDLATSKLVIIIIIILILILILIIGSIVYNRISIGVSVNVNNCNGSRGSSGNGLDIGSSFQYIYSRLDHLQNGSHGVHGPRSLQRIPSRSWQQCLHQTCQ